MSKIRLQELVICITYITMINLFFTIILFSWVTDDDLNNIPKGWGERFVSIFYYLITTFTTTGYGDIYAKSVGSVIVPLDIVPVTVFFNHSHGL